MSPKTKDLSAAGLWNISAPDKKYELVEGELIEMTPPGGRPGKTALRLGRFLQTFVDSQELGEVMVETGYRLATEPDTVRSPDVSFISTGKIPAGGLPDGFLDGTPDLAVEVVSPHDTAAEIQAKVQNYLEHGAQVVWVVYPQQRSVMVFLPDGTARTLAAGDSLSGDPVLPDFSCNVSEIFS